ncbi:MAG: replication protein RepA [Myxococcaceae bacterium]
MEKDKKSLGITGLPLFDCIENLNVDKENHDGLIDHFSPTLNRVITTSADISMDPHPEQIDFLHSVLCQLGMPRKRVEERVFERNNGAVSMVLEAGRLYRRGQWVDMQLPYGTRPRLVMVHISSEAIRTKSRTIEIGESIYEFLKRLCIDPSGGPRGGYTMFKKQMEALAACRMNLGWSLQDRDISINTQPISRFDAWLVNHGPERPLWPSTLDLSQEFFETLTAHAVPLDHRALAAIKHSALALDIYTWLAHRLCRIKSISGIMLSWNNLKDQFGQEYKDNRDFKKEFRAALRQVHAVYPDSKLEQIPGGFILKPSHPPVRKTHIFMPSNNLDLSVDK